MNYHSVSHACFLILNGRFFFYLFFLLCFHSLPSLHNCGYPASMHHCILSVMGVSQLESVTFSLLGHLTIKRHGWIWWRVLSGTRNSALCKACSDWEGYEIEQVFGFYPVRRGYVGILGSRLWRKLWVNTQHLSLSFPTVIEPPDL